MKFKSALYAIVLTAVTTINASACNLSDVVSNSLKLAQLTSKEKVLHFEKPHTLNIGENVYQIRFFVYKNSDAKVSFADSLKDSNVKFSPLENHKNAYFIRSSDEEKAKGLHYVLSLGLISGPGDTPPTLKDVLKNSNVIANQLSSPLALPGSIESLVSIKGKTYQIRYALFDSPDNELSFAEFVRKMNVAGQKPKTTDNGYGPLQVFQASDEIKKEGYNYVPFDD